MDQELTDRRPASLLAAALKTYGTNFAAAVLSLANVYIMARALGPTGRGDVAFVMAIPLLVFTPISFSLQESNANLGGLRPELRSRLATNSILAAAVLGAIGATAIALLVTLVPAVGGEVHRGLLFLGLAAIPTLLLKIYLSMLLQSDYYFMLTNISWLSGPMTTATVNGILTLLGVITVETAVAVWITGQMIGAVPLIVGVQRHFGFGRLDVPLLRKTLRFGLKTHVSRTLGRGTYRADQWFVGASVGSRELGLYSVAFAWAELMFYLPAAIVQLQRPDLVRASAREAAELAARAFRRTILIAFGVVAGLIVAAPFLCVTVFGEAFRESIASLRVLALAAPGIVAAELLSNTLIAQRRAFAATISVAVTFAITLALVIVLVPVLGGLGAAIATTAAWTAGGLAAALTFMRSFGVSARVLMPRSDDLTWYARKVRELGTAAPAAIGSRRRDR